MGKVKVLNSTFELSLRFLSIMKVCRYSLSEYRLRAYSYLSIHLSDIMDSSRDIHPALPYRSSLFVSTQAILHPAIHLLLAKGLVECSYEECGLRYSISVTGLRYIDMIGGTYKDLLFSAIEEVDSMFRDYDDSHLRSVISSRINKWGAEFEHENLLTSEKYAE